jgi:molecular chaperone DnaK
LKEHDAKLAAADKEAVSKAIEKTREAAKTDDLDRIKSAVHELEQASHALSKTLYEKAGAVPGGGPSPGAGPGPKPAAGGEDDAIDAEFEVKE